MAQPARGNKGEAGAQVAREGEYVKGEEGEGFLSGGEGEEY